jgi:hypothetical protein
MIAKQGQQKMPKIHFKDSRAKDLAVMGMACLW